MFRPVNYCLARQTDQRRCVKRTIVTLRGFIIPETHREFSLSLPRRPFKLVIVRLISCGLVPNVVPRRCEQSMYFWHVFIVQSTLQIALNTLKQRCGGAVSVKIKALTTRFVNNVYAE